MKEIIANIKTMQSSIDQELAFFTQIRRGGLIDKTQRVDDAAQQLRTITAPLAVAAFPELETYSIATNPYDLHKVLWLHEMERLEKLRQRKPTKLKSGELFSLKGRPERIIQFDMMKQDDGYDVIRISVAPKLKQAGYIIIDREYNAL